MTMNWSKQTIYFNKLGKIFNLHGTISMSICCKSNVKLMYNFRNLPLYRAERVLLYILIYIY